MTQEQLAAIAQEYGITLELKKRNGLTMVNYIHGERTYAGEHWIILQHRDEAAHRQGFEWIVNESARLDAIAAQEDELIAQACAGNQAACATLVEMCVERIQGNMQTSLYNQKVREAVCQRMNEVLASPYPFGKMHEIARSVIERR